MIVRTTARVSRFGSISLLAVGIVWMPAGSAAAQIDSVHEVADLNVPIIQAPLPGPGQTIHWTVGQSPISVSGQEVIPAGGTVIVDPGVTVTVGSSAVLSVQGNLLPQGTSGAPVTFNGAGRLEVSGTLDAANCVVACLIRPDNGGSLLFSSITFQSTGALTTAGAPTYIWNSPSFIRVDGCSFNGTSLRVDTCTVVLRDTSFSDTFCEVGNGYVHLDNLSIDNAPYNGLNLYEFMQPVYLNNLSVANASLAGLDIAGANFFVGDNVTLTGNLYPVQLGGASILPGSVLPSTGNVNNYINVDNAFVAAAGGTTWADAGLPYVIQDGYTGGRLSILPGVNIKLGANATFWGDPGFVEARGLPGNPVVFERFDPAQSWQGLQYFQRFENCIIDGGQIGARFHSSSSPGYIDNSIIQNCDYGTQNNAVVRKTQFINNATGSWGDSWPDALSGATGANSFEGNGVAIDSTGHLIDAQNNWWGDASGPSASNNPGGSGDAILGAGVSVTPFLTNPPNFADRPPRVHLLKSAFLMHPGSKVIINWESEDDGGVVAHRIDFDHPLEGVSTVADLPGSRHAFEWTVPDIGFAVNNKAPALRVTAIDALGQEGWDKQSFLIPTGDVQGTLDITTDLSGPFVAGTEVGSLCWDENGTNPIGFSVGAALYVDGDKVGEGLGGVTSYLTCLSGQLQMPMVSTDTARVALVIQESLNNVKYMFSDEFTIRPDVRLGDDAPAVELTSPLPGQSFAGASIVPVAWTASDDEGLRGFDIQASYDGGGTWHNIAERLAPTLSALGWQLPPSDGFADVRVRVIATDLHYQTSSDGRDTVFSITPGPASGILFDTDGDGDVDRDDYTVFRTCLAGPRAAEAPPQGCTAAQLQMCDADADGDVDMIDSAQFLMAFDGSN